MRRLALASTVTLVAVLVVFGLLVPGVRAEDRAPVGASLECVLMTWDAARADCTQRLLDEGKLPHLARLAASGVRARYSQTSFPSKTAVGHASLFTGCYTAANGIAANKVARGPDALHDALDLASGFDPGQLTAEPFWHATARQGRRTLVFHAPLSGRDADSLALPLFVVDGYSSPKSDFEILDGRRLQADSRPWRSLPRHEGAPRCFIFRVGDTAVFAAVLDTVLDGKVAPDTVVLSTDRDSRARGSVVLAASPTHSYSPPLIVRYAGDAAGVHFMLLSLGPAMDDLRLVKSSTAIERMNGVPVTAPYLEKTGGFIGNGPVALYDRGELGKPFYEGGDGTAEARYLAAVRLIAESFSRKVRYWVAQVRPQVLVTYIPFPDEALHMWLGVAAHAEHSQAAWRNLDVVYRLCDDYLGTILSMAPARMLMALASDHGMAPVEKEFHPNVVLREAGLLAVGSDGRPDLAHTRILYGYEDGTFLRVNRARYRNGVVSPAQERETIEKAVTALSEARDAETGMAVVTGFYYPGVDGATFGFGGPRGGDVYLDLAPGYSFHPSPVGPDVVRLAHPQGVHVFNPLRDDMHAIFYAQGPGIPAGRVLPPIRSIQVVPTLCRMLGIDPPRQTQGQPISW